MNSTFLHAYQTHYFLSYGKAILTRQSQCRFESFPPTLNLNSVTFEAEWKKSCLSFLQFSIFKAFILDQIVQNHNLRWFKTFKSRGNRIENRRKGNGGNSASGLTAHTQWTTALKAEQSQSLERWTMMCLSYLLPEGSSTHWEPLWVNSHTSQRTSTGWQMEPSQDTTSDF